MKRDMWRRLSNMPARRRHSSNVSMKKEHIFIACVLFIFFCLFLFYTRLEVQRLIFMRVQSAQEVSRTASGYLRAIRAGSLPIIERGGALILESPENEDGK